jgi:hypothetical protein
MAVEGSQGVSEFFEYDPDYGITTDLAWSESEQKMTVIRSQDVEPYLDHAKANRNELGLNKRGINENWWPYATIPPIVQVQLRAKGIDVGNKAHFTRLIEEINTNYPHLKMTTGKMGGKIKQHFI